MKKIFVFLLICFCTSIFANLEIAPVSYKGRIRPFGTYAESIFNELYHAAKVDKGDAHIFGTQDPMTALSKIYIDGWEKWQNTPIIWIDSKVKKILQLNHESKRFSFDELKKAIYENVEPLKIIATYYYLKNHETGAIELKELARHLRVEGFIVLEEAERGPWNLLKQGSSIKSQLYDKHLAENLIKTLQRLALFESFKGIHHSLSFKETLKEDPHFHMMPGRYQKGEWFGLQALTLAGSNPTLYKEASFHDIQDAFFAWSKDVGRHTNENFGKALINGYKEIAGQPFLQSAHQQTFYPSLLQLELELIYNALPLIQLSIAGYLAALFFLLAFPDRKRFQHIGIISFSIALLLQFCSLILRSWILMRPPVSNMFETVIYVPFVASIAAIYLSKKMQSLLPLMASSLLSVVLLSVIEISDLNSGLENVQAVLNSNFWLIIHVLMIVGSYGILILAGILAHFYLLAVWRGFKEIRTLENCILQSLYLGTALLIPGTLLGGVWAAQSWGRFWDWDPKESWAFISICTYLIIIHLFRFNKIGFLGLSFGAVIGLAVISFTWYGVNYILGTGMHTYGFGSGSHVYYLIFLLAESAFLIYMALRLRRNFLCKTHIGYIKDWIN